MGEDFSHNKLGIYVNWKTLQGVRGWKGGTMKLRIRKIIASGGT